MFKKVASILLLSSILLALAACGGGGATNLEPTPVGDAANGATLFSQPTIGPNDAPGCVTCHSLEPDVVVVGPSQAGLAIRAETRVPGQSAEQYIRNSILHPNDYVVEGFVEGVMYQNFATDLTPEQIDDLVAYGLTLK